MNSPTLFGSQVDEDPQGFIDEVFKLFDYMGVSLKEKAELAAYQLKNVTQMWYEQWKKEIPIRVGLVDWGSFKWAFLDRFFPLELRERKMQEFTNLNQRGLSVKENSLKFTQLSNFAPTLVADSRAKMNKFVMRVSGLVVDECRSEMLIPSMNISRLMVYDKQIEKQKLNQGNREVKSIRTNDEDFSNAISDGHGQPRTQQELSNQERMSKPKPLRGSNMNLYYLRIHADTLKLDLPKEA